MSHVSVEILNKSLLEQDVDAIVNPANPRLLHGGGLCGVIYDAVLKSSKNGYGKLIKSISALPVYGDSEMQVRCPYGYAVETPVEGLVAKYIIHTSHSLFANSILQKPGNNEIIIQFMINGRR